MIETGSHEVGQEVGQCVLCNLHIAHKVDAQILLSILTWLDAAFKELWVASPWAEIAIEMLEGWGQCLHAVAVW